LIHYITGALAGAYLLLDDLTCAQTCLGTVLSPQTPMDTMGNRYCWARQAELALCQGDSALALDIVERLIASAPGMLPGHVITFLWKLKGEAVAAMGDTERASALLREAIESAHTNGERFLLWGLHASLGRLYRAMGRHSATVEASSTTSQLVEELAGTLPDGKLRYNFLQRAHSRLSPQPC
jgi:tetratricopeptide (TPR) repeat protein